MEKVLVLELPEVVRLRNPPNVEELVEQVVELVEQLLVEPIEEDLLQVEEALCQSRRAQNLKDLRRKPMCRNLP